MRLSWPCFFLALLAPASLWAKNSGEQKGIVELRYYGFSDNGRYYAFCTHEDSLGGARTYQAVICTVLDASKRPEGNSAPAPCGGQAALKGQRSNDHHAGRLRFELGEGDLHMPQEKLERVISERLGAFTDAAGRLFRTMGISGGEKVLYSATLATYQGDDTKVRLSGKSQVKLSLGKTPLWLRLRERFLVDCKEVPPDKAWEASWGSVTRSEWRLEARIGMGEFRTVYKTSDDGIAHRIVRVSIPDEATPPAAVVIVESISPGYENARIPGYEAVMVPLGRGQESQD